MIAEKIETIHSESPDKGYCRIRDDLDRYYDIHINDKRVLRICRIQNIKSIQRSTKLLQSNIIRNWKYSITSFFI